MTDFSLKIQQSINFTLISCRILSVFSTLWVAWNEYLSLIIHAFHSFSSTGCQNTEYKLGQEQRLEFLLITLMLCARMFLLSALAAIYVTPAVSSSGLCCPSLLSTYLKVVGASKLQLLSSPSRNESPDSLNVWLFCDSLMAVSAFLQRKKWQNNLALCPALKGERKWCFCLSPILQKRLRKRRIWCDISS